MAKSEARSQARNVKGSGLQVPPAELDVLGVLWSQNKATARHIRETMNKYRPMSHGAVVALLTRLEGKGLVSKVKGPVGKAFIYESTRKPEPSYRKLIKDMVQRLFGGNTMALVANLIESQPLNSEELQQLQGLVDNARRSRRS